MPALKLYYITFLYLYIRLAEFSGQSPRLFSCHTSTCHPFTCHLPHSSYLIYGVSLLGGLLHNRPSPKQRFPRISSLLIPALVGPQGFTQHSSFDARRARQSSRLHIAPPAPTASVISVKAFP